MLSRPHVLLSRALCSLELLSRRFRGGLSHSMQASRVFRSGTFFGYFRDKLSQAFAACVLAFAGDSIGHPPLLLCIVRVYGAAHLLTDSQWPLGKKGIPFWLVDLKGMGALPKKKWKTVDTNFEPFPKKLKQGSKPLGNWVLLPISGSIPPSLHLVA